MVGCSRLASAADGHLYWLLLEASGQSTWRLQLLGDSHHEAEITANGEEEAKDAALVQVLDKAVSPERKSWPHRGSIVVLCTLLAFLLAVIWAWVAETTQYSKEDPQYEAQMQLLRMYLFRGLKR